MPVRISIFSLLVLVVGLLATPAAEPVKPVPMPVVECSVRDPFFANEVWAKVGERTCINCHTKTGDAAESAFILEETTQKPEALERNLRAFTAMAASKKDGAARLLAKASGTIKHGGGNAVKPNTAEYRILERFVARVDGKDAAIEPPNFVPGPYFAGIAMASPDRVLRRVALSLAGRLPSDAEKLVVERGGMDALKSVVENMMKEDAFFVRLREGFNDIFLTLGYPGNADDALSYDHFEKTRHWYQKEKFENLPEKERQRAGYTLARTYREALLREPMELITHLVRNELPFTGIVTADYIMVSPYTARGYGIFDQNKTRFKNVEDAFEYIPAQIPALKGRDGKVQPTAKGFYPHAGMLTMFQYLRRYPTTITNRNRLRSRMYYQHFLGVDVMALAPRVGDAAEASKRYEIPTMQAAECVVCHKTVDPIAGLFRDYFNEEGHYGPRKGGWFADMFQPGREGTELPNEEAARTLQWLGAQTAKDPRFAVAMVEHVYYLLMGRRPLLAPQDIHDPLFTPQRRAYIEQRKAIQEIAEQFTKANFNLKVVFQSLIASPFYRADGLAEAAKHPHRRAELDDLGVVHMLTPEQLERKISAVFGKRWGRLGTDGDSKMFLLYGGIDSKEVTQRATDPSGAMGAIQRIMANDVACKNVASDFAKPAKERKLFPQIEPNIVPDDKPETEKQIRAAIVHLYEYLHGRTLAANHADVILAYELFTGIVLEARNKKGLSPRESYYCQAEPDKRATEDPHYTVRAWRAVVTYMLRQDAFLYE